MHLKDVEQSESEDIVQQALTRILEQYLATEIHTSFAAWAQKVLANTIAEYYRRQSMIRRKLDSIAQNRSAEAEFAPDEQLKMGLKRCLSSLHEYNPIYARILNLHYQGYDTDHICRKLDITPGNMYVLLSRARARMRECLMKQGLLGD